MGRQRLLGKTHKQHIQGKRKTQRGLGMIELVPVLMIFALLLNFTFGLFGVVHSGILNSVAARNYAFETFRNRSHLNRLRDAINSDKDVTYFKFGQRIHGTLSENVNQSYEWIVTERSIKFSQIGPELKSSDSQDDHSRVYQIRDPGSAKEVYNQNEGIFSVWLRTVYGICLNRRCRPYDEGR